MKGSTPLRKQHDAWITSPQSAAGLAGRRSREAERPGAATGRPVAPAGIEYVPYGPDDTTCEIPAMFDSIELEYAAIRRGAGAMDAAQRGTLVVTGADRVDFLNRMVTQQLADLAPGGVRETFLVNRKGRIEADLLVAHLDDRTIIDVDVHDAAKTAQILEDLLFAEDVAIADASETHHRIALHGPLAIEALAAASSSVFFAQANLQVVELAIDGTEVVAIRRDQVGEPGLELVVARDAAVALWERLLGSGATASREGLRIRPAGWFAYNIARIEAGTPLANIDFGPTNIPHETGLLDRRVSFTKGCYPGQEVVARVQNLGRPKQVLVGLRMRGGALPTAGGQVFAPEVPPETGESGSAMGEQVGVVTSSTLSPMLGAAPIAFAMLRFGAAAPGTVVVVNAEGGQIEAEVQGLRFVETAGAAGGGAPS